MTVSLDKVKSVSKNINIGLGHVSTWPRPRKLPLPGQGQESWPKPGFCVQKEIQSMKLKNMMVMQVTECPCQA